MINDILQFKKLKEECSNILLIDENLCIGKSYDIINKNIISLSSAIKQFETDIIFFNDNFTYFSAHSANHIETNDNIKNNIASLNSLTTLISSLSTNWTKPIGVFYSNILPVSTWNTNKTSYPTGLLLTWLNSNFPVIKFTETQSIILYVTLYDSPSFRFDAGFFKKFNENCYIAAQNVQIECAANACPISSGSSCNYTSAAGVHGCGDPINGCFKTGVGGFTGPVTCPTAGQKVLSVSHTKTRNDTHISTSFGLKYIKNTNNTSWQYVSKI